MLPSRIAKTPRQATSIRPFPVRAFGPLLDRDQHFRLVRRFGYSENRSRAYKPNYRRAAPVPIRQAELLSPPPTWGGGCCLVLLTKLTKLDSNTTHFVG